MDFLAVVRQFRDPDGAYCSLAGPKRASALIGAFVFILLTASMPFLLTGRTHPTYLQVPILILFERIAVSFLGGVSVYILTMATGEKKPLMPAVYSCFLAMGPFVAVAVVLSSAGVLAGLPEGFSWSPAELLTWLPPGRVSLFLLVFTSRFDIASVITVSLWGRGLSSLWSIGAGRGPRLAWTVYLTGMLLLALPVLVSTFDGEGAP
jgi:hypothetical protein